MMLQKLNKHFYPAYLIIGPLKIIAIVALLIITIDYSSLTGLLIIIIKIPFQTLLGKLLHILMYNL